MAENPVIHGRDHRGIHPATGKPAGPDPAKLIVDATSNVGTDQGVGSYGAALTQVLTSDGSGGSTWADAAGSAYGLDALVQRPFTMASGAADVTTDATHAQWFIDPYGTGFGTEWSSQAGTTPADRWTITSPGATSTMASGQQIFLLVKPGLYLIFVQVDLSLSGATASPSTLEAIPVRSTDGAVTWSTSIAFPNNALFSVNTQTADDQLSKVWCVQWTTTGAGIHMGVLFNLYSDPSVFAAATGSMAVTCLTEGALSFI